MRAGVGRIIIAVIASYGSNAVLILATESILRSLTESGRLGSHSSYFVIDLVSQGFYQVFAGYLCAAIAQPSHRSALAGLIVIGLAIGSISLVVSWKQEPHWYSIALFAIYVPCVCIGWALKNRPSAGPR